MDEEVREYIDNHKMGFDSEQLTASDIEVIENSLSFQVWIVKRNFTNLLHEIKKHSKNCLVFPDSSPLCFNRGDVK